MKQLTKYLSIVMCALFFNITIRAQITDPQIIFNKSSEACKNLKSIEYDVVLERLDKTGKKIKHGEANIKQAKLAGKVISWLPGIFLVFSKLYNEKEEIVTDYSYDGKELRIYDGKKNEMNKVENVTMQSAYIIPMENAMLGMPAFSEENPDLAQGKNSSRIADDVIIMGENCYAIEVETSSKDPEGKISKATATWYFSKTDFLPRGNKTLLGIKTLKIIRINFAFTPEDFVLQAKAGGQINEKTGFEPKTEGLIAVGKKAPDFSLKDPSGKAHSLKDYAGKVVLIDFWGTWCFPCKKAMPAIQRLYDKYKTEGLVVLGLNVYDDEGDPVKYMKDNNYTYQLLMKADKISQLYQAKTFPTIYLIGKDGNVLHAEYAHREKAESDLDVLIKKELSTK